MLASTSAHALDLPKIFGKPIKLDVTEVTIVAQRFDSREVNPIGEGGGWGQWINRLNAKLDWNHFTVGVRLDSAAYWNTLSEQCHNPDHQYLETFGTVPSASGNLPCSPTKPPNQFYPSYLRDDLTRYQNSIYPAKLWGTYTNKAVGLEVTLGDAYVQFARGLVLSMRKLDDLGIDNTVRGIKVTETKGPFSLTVVAGMANPSRVDEATGQSLFVSKRVTDQLSPVYDQRLEQPVIGADQILGAEIQAGRQTPVVVTSSMSYINRCAPNSYSPLGRITNPSTGNDLFGYCGNDDVNTWLSAITIPNSISTARHVSTVSESIELPKIGKEGGSFYVVAALQHRDGINAADVTTYDSGTALYATYTRSTKKVSTTVEFKDYRNFYPAGASIDVKRVAAFNAVAWSAVPTIESIIQDNMLGSFNVCVDGLRIRNDLRINKHVLLYQQGIFTISKGEQNAKCDKNGNLSGAGQAALTDYVFDGLLGWQTDFDHESTIFNGTIGGRQDYLGTGDTYIQQAELTYTFSHKLSKTTAIELIGRHRIRYERGDNLGPANSAEAWVEGENYTGFNIAPKWVFTQGFEYSTRDLPASTTFAGISNYPAWLYLSLGGVYKFTKESNLRLFVGQQRGGLKCISGVCRVFPPFEGARMELTVRF
jgi:hypothetical protein